MNRAGPSVLVTGAGGRIARATIPLLVSQGWTVTAAARRDLDVSDRTAVVDAISALRPDTVLNLAAWTDADACETDPERALSINGRAVGHLRDAAAAVGAHLCHVSTDYVFDGSKGSPYQEDDPPAALSAYGRSKLLGEQEAGDRAAVVRVAWVSCREGRSLVRAVLDASAVPGSRLRYVTDQVGSPSIGDDVAGALVHLLSERVSGIFHAANSGQASPYELAHFVLEAAGREPSTVEPISTADLGPERAAVRPRYSVLDSSRLHRSGGPALPSWTDATSRLVGQLIEASSSR